jgi:uroporphyrinogen III methyltransferase / synthase
MPLNKGKVYLIGAGPGDPGLITLKAVSCLAKADVVLYDHLVSSLILDYAPARAEKIYAGKTGGVHFIEQDEINGLLVAKARLGKTVARLKGGDPFVLGRGGEEAEALRKNNILFEIVPGVTSAVSVPAYAGIPVTHRSLASSLAIITGHEDPAKKNSSINWGKLATATDTLVILMGMQKLPQIAARLIKHGRKASTPVAVIRDGTLPSQVTLTGTLKNIAGKVSKAGLEAPAVIVIGDVVRLRESLRWFDSLPLFGKRILVTRAASQAGSFEKLLTDHGALPVRFSSIAIKSLGANKKLDNALSHLDKYDWIAFTSVNGVEVFFNRLRDSGLDSRCLSGLKIGAIGPMTAQALQKMGITADYMPSEFTGHGFVAGLKKRQAGGQRFLLPRADIADDEIIQGLKKLGAGVDEIAVYSTTRPGSNNTRLRELLLQDNIDVVTFTSSSTVTNLLHGLSQAEIAQIRPVIACIGPKTARTAAEAGLKVAIIAREQTMPGLLAAMEDYFSKEA